MRLDPDALSAQEASEFLKDAQAKFDEARKTATEQMAANEGFATSAKNVENDIFDQLRATRTMPDDKARAGAAFARSFVATMATRMNMTPEDLYDRHKYTILAAATGESKASSLHQQAIENIRSVVEAAKQPGHAAQKAVIASVNPWMAERAGEQGLKIDGFDRVIDGSAVRHSLKNHGDAETERSRGQVAITEADFEHIPEILEKPDYLVFGLKNKIGRDVIVSAKAMPDGTTIYLEEIRRKNKELATQSMWKFATTMDADRLAANLHLYARDDSGTPIIVRHPSANKNEPGILHQGADGGTRGGFDPSTRTTLLGPKADLSTLVHETGHYFLTVFADLARDPDAPPEVKADMDALLKWFGVKDLETWHSMSLEEQRPFHEQFAYNVEKYLAEGKAPSRELEPIFSRFAVWLKHVYKNVIVDQLNTIYRREHGKDLPILTGEARSVMERMLASEEQIRNREAIENMVPKFKSAGRGEFPESWKECGATGLAVKPFPSSPI